MKEKKKMPIGEFKIIILWCIMVTQEGPKNKAEVTECFVEFRNI